MKNSLIKPCLLGLICITLIWACKKNDPAPDDDGIENRTPVEVIEDITNSMANADSISAFVNALKSLSLQQEDVAEGLTVFAPLNPIANDAQAISKVAATEPLNDFSANDLTDSVLMDHLVKGVFGLDDLTDRKTLTSLSGKVLLVTKTGNKIWINGVPISGEIAPGGRQVIYTVKKPLTGTTVDDALQTTTIEITVWDAMGWEPNRPKGTTVGQAQVFFYASQADYANSTPAYEAVTDTSGKALLEDITPGTYFIEVSKDGRSNIFAESEQPENGVFMGLAAVTIFQSAAAIDSAPAQSGAAPGNFQWLDANNDGKIDEADRVALPYNEAVVADSRTTSIEILIGYTNNAENKPLTEEELANELASIAASLANWQADWAVTDALLAGDVTQSELQPPLNGRFQGIGDFAFNATHPLIMQLWQGGYGFIERLDALEKRAPQAVSSTSSLRLLRAFAYLRLLTYFGNIPLQGERGQLNNQNADNVHTFIRNELEGASGGLPERAQDPTLLSKGAVDMLLAKLALLGKEYDQVATLTTRIIAAGHYSLVPDENVFRANSSEIIWASPVVLGGAIKEYFYQRDQLPFLRLRETYFMNIEANAAIGNMEVAINTCNMLLSLKGMPPLPPNISKADLLTQHQGLWITDMKREGVQFANTVRWERAAELLGVRGYSEPKHRLLPIPVAVIDANPQMVQNPGY